MKTLCLKLPEAMAASLAAVAHKRSLSKSAVVRAILEESLGHEKSTNGSCLDIAADLAGGSAGPHDLSTRKEYLKGYGQ